MKEHFLPRIILPRSLAAFVATLAVWAVFAFIPFTGKETPSGPYAALEPLLVSPAAAACNYRICTGGGNCIPETLALQCNNSDDPGKCDDYLCD